MAELKEFDEILGNCLEALERGEGLADVLARYPQASEELKPLEEEHHPIKRALDPPSIA